MKAAKVALALSLLPALVQAETLKGFETSFYGFIKSSAMYTDSALASYNSINLSAPTNAAPRTRAIDHESRTSLQVQQSRLGLDLKKGDNLSAKVEFDFIDFNKSSPTTQMVPRVRIASVQWKRDDWRFVVGQDWDLFSPTTATTYDYVGLYFLAGNSGFMRQQFQAHRTLGKWELSAALGMAGNNPGTTDGDLETSNSPTTALRLTRSLENGKVGLSAIHARLKYSSVDNSSHDSYGLNAFFEKQCGSVLIKTEFYYAQNLANIGSLTIGKGNATTDLKEHGAHLTASWKATDTMTLFGGSGIAQMENSRDVPVFSLTATDTIKDSGIRSNILSRVGADFALDPDLSWVVEASRYQTAFNQTNGVKSVTAFGLETGIQLRF